MFKFFSTQSCALFACLGLSLQSHNAAAADHIDWPEGPAFAFPELDITDVLTWVPKKGKLALGLNLHPNAGSETEFSSDDVVYRFRLRPVVLEEQAGASVIVPKLVAGEAETTINCTVENDLAHCTAGNYNAYTRLNHTKRFYNRAALQIDAGLKKDSFFIDVPNTGLHIFQSTDAFDIDSVPSYTGPVAGETPSNTVANFGVLHITAVIDVNAVLGKQYDHYIVAADILLNGEIFERMGRPETSNFVLRDNELKDEYNGGDVFALSQNEKTLYSELFSKSIQGWDRLDRKVDWPETDRNALIDTLLLDGLVVNVRKKCRFNEDGLFDLERATGPLSHYSDRCGGRTPNADQLDSITTLLVAGPRALKDLYGDGIDKPAFPATKAWPYFIPFEPEYSAPYAWPYFFKFD